MPDVTDISICYHATNAVVIPLRAGGGTRIKLLEAFAHRRPVVSTMIGAEGLHVTHGEHLLIADSAADIARECLRLMTDCKLASALVARAFDFVTAHHSFEAVRGAFRVAGALD